MFFRKMIMIICFVCLHPLNVFSASFDCLQASSTLEKTICNDPQLSKADEEMGDYYAKLKDTLDVKQFKLVLDEQRVWLKQRIGLCAEGDAACLLPLYKKRIMALRIKNENLVPFEIDNPGSLQGLRGTCTFSDLVLPDNVIIFAAGTYGGRQLDVQIDQSGHQATQFDVIVNYPDRPVVLLLGAYEPSIWNIGWTKETRILAVAASGYHRQAIAGLPKDTPILISTYDNKGPCGHIYVSERTLAEVNPFSTRLFGKPVDLVYFAGAGKVMVGKPITQAEKLFTSQDVTPDSLVDKTLPLAGPAGLKQAIAKGYIRLATREDAEAWVNKKAKSAPKNTLPPVAGGDNRRRPQAPYGNNVFVILKQFRLPSGLYGAHSATFYLPDGVAYPEGDLGHSTLYDYKSLSCHNTLCDER